MPHTGRASFIVKGFLNQPPDGGSRPPTVLTTIRGPKSDLWKRVTGARAIALDYTSQRVSHASVTR
jgi:hypothetical protein